MVLSDLIIHVPSIVLVVFAVSLFFCYYCCVWWLGGGSSGSPMYKMK